MGNTDIRPSGYEQAVWKYNSEYRSIAKYAVCIGDIHNQSEGQGDDS
jgi:hypothetical protein